MRIKVLYILTVHHDTSFSVNGAEDVNDYSNGIMKCGKITGNGQDMLDLVYYMGQV